MKPPKEWRSKDPTLAYLGHFARPDVLAAGHNTTDPAHVGFAETPESLAKSDQLAQDVDHAGQSLGMPQGWYTRPTDLRPITENGPMHGVTPPAAPPTSGDHRWEDMLKQSEIAAKQDQANKQAKQQQQEQRPLVHPPYNRLEPADFIPWKSRR